MLCISQISQLTSLFDFCWSLFNLLCSLNKFFTEWVYLYDCVCIYRHGCFDVKKTVFVCWLSILRQCKTVQQGAMHESFTPPFTANYPQIKLQKGFLIEFLNAYTYLTYLWSSMPLNKPFSSFTNRPDPFFLWYFLFCGVIKKISRLVRSSFLSMAHDWITERLHRSSNPSSEHALWQFQGAYLPSGVCYLLHHQAGIAHTDR